MIPITIDTSVGPRRGRPDLGLYVARYLKPGDLACKAAVWDHGRCPFSGMKLTAAPDIHP